MKIICIGRNYAEHAKELGNEIPSEPVIFMKPETALLLNGEPFTYPEFTQDLHYECELVLRISTAGKAIQKADASKYYDAIGLGIDFTARDLQDALKKKGLPWEKAKAFDQSAVVGSFTSVSSFEDKSNILFTLMKNDERVQEGNSALMMFAFDSIIANVSRYFSLNKGDLIFTGTPAGVGPCVPGDLLEGYLKDEKVLSVQIQ